MDKSRKPYLYAGLAILFWSTVPTAFKISLGEMEILPMLTIASFVSALVLLIVLLISKKWHLIIKSTTGEIISSAILGFINPFVYYIILLSAYRILPAQVAQPLNMIWPIIFVFLSVIILKNKIERKSYLAMFISFLGVYIISSRGDLFNSAPSDLTGVLLATGSSVFWALYFVLNIRDKRDEVVKLLLNFMFGFLYFVILMTITGGWGFEKGIKGITASAYLGIFEMGITFFLWLKALQMSPSPDKISNLVYVAPFLSLVFVHYILHEPVYYTTPAGLLLIISGILIQNRKRKTGK